MLQLIPNKDSRKDFSLLSNIKQSQNNCRLFFTLTMFCMALSFFALVFLLQYLYLYYFCKTKDNFFMRKLLYIFLFLICFACSSSKEDEQEINSVIKEFYHCLNNNKYKDFAQLLSPNMRNEISFWKNAGENSVKYVSVKVVSVDIEAEKAKALVSTTDEFNNKVNFVWHLIKIKNKWKMDNYRNSKSVYKSEQSISQNHAAPSRTDDMAELSSTANETESNTLISN